MSDVEIAQEDPQGVFSPEHTGTTTLVIDPPDVASPAEVEALADTPAAERQLPWQGITTGEAGEDRLTSKQMLIRAELNWQVGIRPYMRQTAAGLVESTKMFETYRVDTDETVGVAELGGVKSRYELLQNDEAFDFGDALVDAGLARWTHAGMQQGGAKVFMTMLLEEEFQVLGGTPMKVYLFLGSSHDGARSLTAAVTPINVFCLNQSAAVQADNIGRFGIAHTASMKAKLADAHDAIARAGEYSTMIKEQAELLATKPITADKARHTLLSVIPAKRPKRAEMVDGIMQLLATSPNIDEHRDDCWGLLNATEEWMDHLKTQRNGNARYESITFGEGAKLRVNLARMLAGRTN